eukprot:4463921-Amphidinium_carterae.1
MVGTVDPVVSTTSEEQSASSAEERRRKRWWERRGWQATYSDAGWAASGAGADQTQPNHRRTGQASFARCAGQGQAGQVPEPLFEGSF